MVAVVIDVVVVFAVLSVTVYIVFSVEPALVVIIVLLLVSVVIIVVVKKGSLNRRKIDYGKYTSISQQFIQRRNFLNFFREDSYCEFVTYKVLYGGKILFVDRVRKKE